MDKNDVKLCKCGCGGAVNQRRNGTWCDFINHHHIRLDNPATKESFKEKMRGENNPAKRPEVRAKISKAGKGKNTGDNNHMRQPKYRKMFSEMWMGKKNPMYGRKGNQNPCYGKPSTLKGTKIPEERKKKISDSNKGKAKSEDHKIKISKTFKEKGISDGENNPFHGKRHNYETKLKISQFQKKKYGMDETHSQWNEIISPLVSQIRNLVDYKSWRKSVFKRDNFIC